MEPYYNSSYGTGLEGLFNYTNLLVDGWLVNSFLVVIFLITTYVLSKSEWELSSVVAYSFLITFISSMFFRLFTQVNEMIILLTIIGLAGSVTWNILSRR